MVHHRKMAVGRDAAGRGLQSGDAAEMRWNADGTAAIAADSSGRAERSNGGRLAAAGSSGRALQVPRIVGAAGDEIVRFIVGEEFGRVRLTQDDGARGAQAGDGGGVLGGFVPQAEAAAAPGGAAGYVEAFRTGWAGRLRRSCP